ncbi:MULTISPECIES: ArgS-related anticodon-binding protein NrtL [unclassified Streptomyces]|uniref:ArgS-related anticodon-binding protein NrtL n=1 Tax=unclassified Streptomyces TaxID=2593676 RepID=UPI0022503134|nr:MULTISPECIES: DALR anticodon-binding domain-containing protein [unclassified Streptomyces]MCX4988434.1 DALR anticodon-binding domain-containing protein [Streptomyces sp. NBC_00568]MCX5006361.1 DALR anticodon-binding domain-containing protein [Streptomyces sp. NBC_00638]
MTPVELSRTVLRAVRRAVDVGELSVSVPASVAVTPPGPGGCGDYATNIALRLAGPAGRPAREVADVLRPHIADAPGVADVAVTGPGFLNITLGGGASAALVEEVLGQGTRYGHGDTLAGQVVELRVPYDTRAEVVADTLVRIVATQGGRAEVRHAEPVNLRPVPAPENPAPLGPDAARWALLHPAPHDRPRISADHLLQRESNPLFRVRYAHARTRALSRNAATLGFTSAPAPLGAHPVDGLADGPVVDTGAPTGTLTDARRTDASSGTSASGTSASGTSASGTSASGTSASGTLTPATPASRTPTPGTPTPPHEAELLVALAEYPHVLRVAARDRGPDRVARHLVVTADALLGFQHVVLPFGDEKPSAAHRARLALAEAAGTVLAGGLSLLGISAPEHL